MLKDFKRALARVQTDFAFYVAVQTDPDVALGTYDLTADERSALTDPERLSTVLQGGTGIRIPTITIKISGKHDWVNRAPKKNASVDPDHEEKVAAQVAAVKAAEPGDERSEAVLRLMELIG